MTAPGAVVRPVIVAIAHLPLLIVVVFAVPVWMMAALRPATHGEFALRLAREMRAWSRDVIAAGSGAKNR